MQTSGVENPGGRSLAVFAVASCLALNAEASSLQWNGFALLRPQTSSQSIALDRDNLSAQVQIGADWMPDPSLRAHVHVLARNDEDGSRRGRAGIVEAFVEKNFQLTEDRVRVMAGAFFLPTSRENVDSLWETPYTITSSALNSWMGEELRPVGIDVTYMRRTESLGRFTGGATLFAGNDTFGTLPIDRGWAIHDRWTLLGEHVPARVRQGVLVHSSVSAESDDRLGWSGRLKWNNDRGAVQYTRIDNRSDARLYGDLFNWATRYNILGGDFSHGPWTFLAEAGWGTTAIETQRGRRSSKLRSSYLLVSRRFGNMRASVRGDEFRAGNDDPGLAWTAAFLWEPRPRLRAGVEAITVDGEERLAVEARLRF